MTSVAECGIIVIVEVERIGNPDTPTRYNEVQQLRRENKMDTLVKVETPNGKASLMSMLGGSVFFEPKSTAVKTVIYVGTVRMLTVTYTNGGTYRYEGVAFAKVIDLLGAESVGAFIAKQIKPNHKCYRDDN